MSKIITVSPASIDFRRQLLKTESNDSEITIAALGTEDVTGTVTAPAGFFIVHPTTGERVMSYNFLLVVVAPEGARTTSAEEYRETSAGQFRGTSIGV